MKIAETFTYNGGRGGLACDERRGAEQMTGNGVQDAFGERAGAIRKCGNALRDRGCPATSSKAQVFQVGMDALP